MHVPLGRAVQEISLHLYPMAKRIFSPGPEMIMWSPGTSYRVPPDFSIGTYQVYRVFSGNAEMPEHLKRPGTSKLWLVPNGIYLTQESLFWSLVAMPKPYLFIFLDRVDWSKDGILPKPDQSEFFPRTFKWNKGRSSVFSGVKAMKYDAWEGLGLQ